MIIACSTGISSGQLFICIFRIYVVTFHRKVKKQHYILLKKPLNITELNIYELNLYKKKVSCERQGENFRNNRPVFTYKVDGENKF